MHQILVLEMRVNVLRCIERLASDCEKLGKKFFQICSITPEGKIKPVSVRSNKGEEKLPSKSRKKQILTLKTQLSMITQER